MDLGRNYATGLWNSSDNVFSRSNSRREEDDDETALTWAALERLPTYDRVRRGIFQNIIGEQREVEIGSLGIQDLQLILDRLINAVDESAEQFLFRMRRRFDAVGLEFPKIEVRFQQLKVDAYIHVGSRALPTIPNFICNMAEAFLRQFGILRGRRTRLSILQDISGIIRLSRMTLLLGPPGSGKTTLLLALAGRLSSDLKMSGSITYNGHRLKEFVPQRTSAYVSQQDSHVAEMTVRETLDFAGRCQGVGIKYDMLLELSRREKDAGIKPDEDLDLFMKACNALALEGKQTGLVTQYIMKILGLNICADTIVGDEMLRGISGGQKKRLTTGELLVGPARVLFMDDISTGLDSATTYQIIKYLQHSTHALDGTTMISLLQPAPETYELFDDIILISEGHIVYQGSRENVLEFFEFMGFRCPERKNIADFLQEVTSRKDQRQYWAGRDYNYHYIPVEKFSEAFRSFHVGKSLMKELSAPYDKHLNHPAALTSSSYGVKKSELLRANFAWQKLLMKRNSFIYVFKFIQLLFVAIITMTVFFRTRFHHDSVEDAGIYLGALYFSIIMILFNGFTEVSMLMAKLNVIYKHRDLHFYPCWAYTLPAWVLSIPTSLMESAMWVAVTYYVMGFDPQITRFLRQFLLFFCLHQMSLALFRIMAALGRNMIVSNTFGSFTMLIIMLLGGFITSRDSIQKWWIWGYWFSPLMYAQNAASVNEFRGHSWDHRFDNSNETIGLALLKSRGLFPENYWYWIGVAALLSYTILFNVLFTLFLTYLKPLGKPQAVLSEEALQQRDGKGIGRFELSPPPRTGSMGANGKEKRGMVLPFQPLSMCFSNINYYVDVPEAMKQQGVMEDRLQLLVDVTGAFRPGVLTALVGVSGAGKTTLMDVLAGRKTGGYIEGNISISGYPKNQETFTRISGYCEQNDVHSPCMTVYESLVYSAWLRLPAHVDLRTQQAFVEEVMELVELVPVSGALVGLPGINGLSTEQRKRLTIAVELVANPSIVFMDEPTSGLDARSAAIVMRTVRNIVDTGRTIVCTIHQPSIDIFESFDELLFMKRGGELIYAGLLGSNSQNLIEYFEAIEGVPKIKDGYNPATWMLEVTSPEEENRLRVDFADIYRRSNLYRNTVQDIHNAMGSMYAAVLFIGITNGTASQPVVSIERFVSYRERGAGMYSPLAFAFAQVVIEFPYVFVQTLIYGSVYYAMASFAWTAAKFIWYIFFMYFTLLYFTFYGMMTTAVTPNHNVAAIIAAPFYMLWNLFSGFMIPYKRIPVWWRWYYWANPVAWSLYGLLTSQYGDLHDTIGSAGGTTAVTISSFLNDYFGFEYRLLGLAAVVVVGFAVLFAVIFALAIKLFNFQKR
ncbi:ABC transporter G family member 32 [Nymphaea thermarum]|nr:ABC transporter G family member 32 [Nymphaea thermarum]